MSGLFPSIEQTESLCHGMSVRGLPLDLLFEIANIDFEAQLTLVYAIPALWRRFQRDSAWRNQFVVMKEAHTCTNCSQFYRHGKPKPCKNIYIYRTVNIRGKDFYHRYSKDGPVILQKHGKMRLFHQINLTELQDAAASHWKVIGHRMLKYNYDVNWMVDDFESFVPKYTGILIVSDYGKVYMVDGRLHRNDGPAVEFNDYTCWYRKGELHKTDGPAIIKGPNSNINKYSSDNNTNIKTEYYIGGQQMKITEYKKWSQRYMQALSYADLKC